MSEQITPQTSDVIQTTKRKVMCDGPADGRHPRVYLEMNEGDKNVVCPYCSRVFQLVQPGSITDQTSAAAAPVT